MPYRKVNDKIIEYEVIPQREQIIRVMTIDEFNAKFDSVDTAVKTFNATKYASDALKVLNDKLTEMDAVKTTLGG